MFGWVIYVVVVIIAMVSIRSLSFSSMHYMCNNDFPLLRSDQLWDSHSQSLRLLFHAGCQLFSMGYIQTEEDCKKYIACTLSVNSPNLLT